jgi:hypothetical protein
LQALERFSSNVSIFIAGHVFKNAIASMTAADPSFVYRPGSLGKYKILSLK